MSRLCGARAAVSFGGGGGGGGVGGGGGGGDGGGGSSGDGEKRQVVSEFASFRMTSPVEKKSD